MAASDSNLNPGSALHLQILARPAIKEALNLLLLDNPCAEDMHMFDSLCSRDKALEPLQRELHSYFLTRAEMKDNQVLDMVYSLMKLESRLYKLCDDSLLKDMKKAFKDIIRKNCSVPLISRLLNEKLCSVEISKEALHASLRVFTWIYEKWRKITCIYFMHSYQRDFARRLMLGLSAWFTAERLMANKVKDAAKSAWSDEFRDFKDPYEEMLKDIETSRELNGSFKQSPLGKPFSEIDMSVNVISNRRSWPPFQQLGAGITPESDIHLPRELEKFQKNFEEFYYVVEAPKKNKSEESDVVKSAKPPPKPQYTWHHSLWKGVLKLNSPGGEKELGVNLFQACVLMLFNDVEKLSFQEIKDSTKIDDKKLRMTLQSLACGEFRVLRKLPEGGKVKGADMFGFNEDFTCASHHIEMPEVQIQGSETVDTDDSDDSDE